MHRNDFDPSTIATISSSDVSTTAATALVENIKNILKKLSNATSECSNRTELLAAAWLNLQNLIQTNSEHFERWMQYIVKCTLESMLMDCTKTDVRDLEQLKTRINECAPLLEKYTNIYYRCKYIVENINEPWSHPTLKLIFNDGNQAPTTISDEQLNKEIEYFSIERGCMIEMRARKLIETKCDRLAMNFVTEALRVIQMCTDEHVLRRTVSLGHNQTLLEIYFSLMYKFKESSRLKTELEAMELESVKEFIINSFATIDAHVALTNRKKSIAKPKTGKKEQLSSAARLHKYHLAVSQYALQLILVRILSGEYTTNGLENIFRRLLIEWIRRNKDLTNFEELFQKLIQTAASNSQIYDCCEILFEMYPNDCETALRVFCSELTKEINVLEHKKYDETVDASVILDLEKQTSIRYLYLGQLLHGHPNLEKECILTAFSMNPTYECFQLVCKLAASEQSATEAATMAATTTETTEMTEMTETTAITSHNESIDALPTITSSDLLLNSKEYDALRAPNRLLDSLTCLSENVRSDLVCLLTVPRIKNLNWLVPWLDLKKECEELLVTEKKMQIVENTTASANDKLKFINLNYDDFKDFTPHEYPGIEKGYEIYVADSDSEESVQLVPNKHGDDSDIEIGGGNASEVDTDTAPESKEFIVKEAKRLRARKRRLIQRSQKLLEESENAVQIKKEPNDGDQQKKKQKLPRPMNSDSLKKPNRKPRKRPLKKEKSGEENVPSIPTIKTEPDTDQLIVDIKLEPTDIDIKQEPVDDDTKFDCDEDVSRTFADLSNMQQFNGANFPLTNHFYSVVSKSEPADEMTKSNGIQSMLTTNGDSNHEPLSNFSQLTYPPNQFEQTCTATAIATDDDSNLVNSIIMAAPELQIQAHEQTPPFPLICDDGDFDEDEKVDMQFQNIVGNMNKLLGLNSTQISYLTNDATINSMQSVQESESQSPVINELCPLTQQPPVSDVPVVDEPVVDVPIVDVLVVDVPVVDVPVVNVLVYDEPVVDEPVVDVPVVNVLVYDEPVVDVPVIDVPVVDVPVVDVPVIKPTPNMPVIETDSVMTLDSNSKSSCDVPSALNATNSVIGVQSPKPKNPLMAFRKPKKTTTIKPNDAATVDSSNGQSKDSIATNSPLIASHANAFSIEGNLNVDWTSTSLLNQDDHRNGSTGNLVHGNQYDLPSCNIITTTALSNGQCTERLEKPLILTKHCTVRLNRIPKLDQLSGQDTVYLRELKQPNDVIDNKKETIPLSMADSKANTKSVDADAAAADCDQATNETSSADKTPPSSSPSSSPSQTNQNAMESGGKNAQTAEEDEDEDRKTNHLYPYSSISSSHNHNGNDDDDDCNSSEDTKTSCPGECISLKTEQHNGQQQQQQQKQQQQRQQERSNSGERNQHEHQKQHSGMPQNVSNEMQLCARQSFLMQNHTVSSANVERNNICDENTVYKSGLLVERNPNWQPQNYSTHIHAQFFNKNNHNSSDSVRYTNLVDCITKTSLTAMTSLAPQCAAAANDADDASSSIQHINLYSNVTNNNNCKGKRVVMHKICSSIVKMLAPIVANWPRRKHTNRFLFGVELKLFVILNLNALQAQGKLHKLYQLWQTMRQWTRTCESIAACCLHIERNKQIFRLICVYYAFRCLSLIITTLTLTFTIIMTIIVIVLHIIVDWFRIAMQKKDRYPKLTAVFQSIDFWESVQLCTTTTTTTNTTTSAANSIKTNNHPVAIKCCCSKCCGGHPWKNRFDSWMMAKKQLIKQHCFSTKEKLHCHPTANHLFNSVQPTKLPVAKSRILLQRFFDKNDFIKCHNSVVVIVRMVQIVVPNDKNATALTQSVSGESVTPIEPAAQQPDNNSTNNLSMNSNNGSTSNGDAVNDTSLAASTDAMDSCPIERKANTSTASSVHTMSNKKSNVIMVKRSKLQDNSNGGVPMPVFRSMSISTPKSTENRSPLAATSVIIMNKMGQTGKNGSNLNKTEMYEMPTRTNHLLRILNSPPKPINASPLPTFGANLERTIGGATPLTDFQKALKVQTTLANEVSPLVKAETDQTKLRHLLNDQNGNKKLNNNLFICKTEGKVIRLTPLMGSTITNEVKVLPDLQQQKNICPIILEKKDGISSKSPPPLTVMSTSTTATKNSASVAGTRSVFEEIYAKFMNTKDVQKDAIVEGEKKNGAITTTTLMDVDDTKVIKSGFYSIPTSHTTIISPKQQTTFLQCQGGLVKADGFNVSPVAATFASGDGKIGAKMNTIQAAPAIYLKQMPKHRTAQSKSGLCEILVTNENDLKVLQKTGNETTTTNNLSTTATIANPAMNQIHIFPLITSSNGRNVAISSAQPRTSCIRPQVIITGTNSSDSQRMQTKIEPEKRNLVDQLREFEMVMEQIKEERNINETGDKLMLNNLSGILNQHIIDSCQMRSVGLPQKINLAIIKKATTTGKTITTQKITTTLSDTKRCTSTPVVVVTAAAAANVNASTAKTGRLTIKSPQDVTSTKLNADGTSLIQSTFENVAASVKIDSANFKAVAQQQQQQQQPSAQTQATAAAAAKHPQKSQEDEQTVQRIYDILAQYAEQISSSPDLNNKPAPRRRSNLVSIQSSPITTSGIRMVSSKSSMSSTSSTTVGSIISSSSNSNSSNESYHSATINESRKRTTSLQNDDPNGNDCASNIDTITIQQPADKKRRISNINLDGNDFILTTMPSLSTYTALPKSSTNDMLKTANNQIIITTTTTNAQQQTTNEIIPATIKQEGGSGGELLLTNVNTNLTNGKAQLSTKLKPLTIGVANSSIVESAMVKAGGDGGGAGTGQQSPAAILLPGMSVVVSTEQNLQQQQQQHGQITTKLTNSNNTSGETGARFCGFTTGFPYKINIAGANKCRPFKQCITGGQSYRNDNYILPMGFLKYKNPTTTTTTVISGEQSKINQMNQIVHPNVATVMIPSANVQRDLGGVGNNVKIISTDSVTINKDGGGLAKAQHIQFNIAKKSDNFTTIPAAATSLQSQSMATVGTAPTLLFRTLSGTNIGGIHHSLNVKKSTDDGFTTICEQLKSSSENSSNLLPTFTSIKAHQSDAQPLVESIQLPSQIFQSNRGILILDSNKYATLLTTNYTIPTTTAPVMSETKRLCLDDVKSSTSTSTSSSPLSLLSSAVMSAEPKTTAITMPITSDQSVFSTKIDMKVPICDSEDDFLNGLDSPKCGDDVNDESFDGLHQSGRIFSMHMKTLPSLFGGEYSKSCDDILDPNNHNHDDDDVDGIDDAQELIFHRLDKSSDNVVIIDKHKSDTLTLNSVSSETRLNARTNSIIERELRLQKSLSEECEDLGVDEPSTSDLFPDAFISF